jgi:23S rRNA G2445 N2-methylase RlmL
MSQRHDDASAPCYAMTLPGLEAVSAREIQDDLGAAVKRTAPGLVVFRPQVVDGSLLRLRTVEDVFLLVWGSDALTRRAKDLDGIARWTAKEADWDQLLRWHHAIRPKPKGKPTYHLVAQKHGDHAYRRVDALKAMAKGLDGKFPASWRPADEGAAVEVWLTIHETTAICGLRLSDRTMRHRTYKDEHQAASLRPVLAAAMVRLAEAKPHHLLLDPLCGAGTILAERLDVERQAVVLGGDLEPGAVSRAADNLRHWANAYLARWDARRLPLADASVPRIVTNPPFGKQLSDPAEIPGLYRRLVREFDRVLQPGGRAVLVVSEQDALEEAAEAARWQSRYKVRVRLLGQRTIVSVWEKPAVPERKSP